MSREKKTQKASNSAADSLVLNAKPPRLDRITEARAKGRALFLRFADGLSGTWSFRDLDLDMSSVDLSTIKASASGTSVQVKSKRGESIQLDAASLRAHVDPVFASELEKQFLAMRGPIDELAVTAPKLKK